jgi:mycothiol S-conjugate amidase
VTQRLLAVHAHPDDESSKGAATYAYYVDRGAEVMVVSCTGGERGDVLNEALAARARAERDMAGLRRVELAMAQAIIGFEHRWLGYVDSGMPEESEPLPVNCFAAIPLETATAPLVKIIREFRALVLVTYDENGGYPHPDHVRTHEVSMRAFECAADARQYPELGEPWQISKVYYDRIMNSKRIEALRAALVELDPESSLLDELDRFRRWTQERPYLATKQVAVGDFFPRRDDALRAHASQVAPDSSFFFWPDDLQRRAWPWEDFQLVRSLVSSSVPETDLFAGVAADQEVSSR